MNVLFICTGNTCRSPMAEGLLRAMAAEEKADIQALSAGLFTAYDAPVSPEAVKAVGDRVDISEHSSRPLKVPYVQAADLILAMTEDHKAILLRQFPFDQDKIFTLKEWAGESGDIVDPFGQSQEAYDQCAQDIERCLEKGWDKLQAKQ